MPTLITRAVSPHTVEATGVFPTRDAADAAAAAYLTNWHPCGYGTGATITPRPDGQFALKCRRSTSCD